MSIGVIIEKDRRPKRKDAESSLGAKFALFEQLTAFMDEAYQRKGSGRMEEKITVGIFGIEKAGKPC